MEITKIIRENYTAELEAPEIYVDNEKRRSNYVRIMSCVCIVVVLAFSKTAEGVF